MQLKRIVAFNSKDLLTYQYDVNAKLTPFKVTLEKRIGPSQTHNTLRMRYNNEIFA
jgi:hypothetical protein